MSFKVTRENVRYFALINLPSLQHKMIRTSKPWLCLLEPRRQCNAGSSSSTRAPISKIEQHPTQIWSSLLWSPTSGDHQYFYDRWSLVAHTAWLEKSPFKFVTAHCTVVRLPNLIVLSHCACIGSWQTGRTPSSHHKVCIWSIVSCHSEFHEPSVCLMVGFHSFYSLHRNQWQAADGGQASRNTRPWVNRAIWIRGIAVILQSNILLTSIQTWKKISVINLFGNEQTPFGLFAAQCS